MIKLQFYLILFLYLIHAFASLSLSVNKKPKIKHGKKDSLGVNIARLIIVLSPNIILMDWFSFYEPLNKIYVTLITIGILVWMLGFATFTKSRITLKNNFNPYPIVIVGHKLIKEGIYKTIRHPIYTSYIVCWIGLSLIAQNWLYSFVIGMPVIRMFIRIPKEENELICEFGNEYINYKNNAGKLFPKLNFWKNLLK